MNAKAQADTSPFVAADYLRDEADALAYLQSCIDEDPTDARFIAMSLGTVMRAQQRFRQVAADAQLSRESLYRALSGSRDPAFSTVLRVLQAMGLKLSVQRATSVACGSSEPIVVDIGRKGAPYVYALPLPGGTAKALPLSSIPYS